MSDTDSTLTTAEPDTDAGQTSAPVEAAPADGAAPVEQQAQGDAPATEAAPHTQGEASLTPPNSQTSNPQPQQAAQPPVDWEKRYRDLMSRSDRQMNEWRSRMEQQSQQMSELARWKQEQEQRAKAASLKPWSKAHPENGKFNGLLERAKVVQQQLSRIPASLPPEQQQAMRDAIVGALSPEEQQQISDYRESLANFQRDFFTDPHGTLLPMVEQLAEHKVQQALQRIEAQQSVQRDLTDPQMAPMVQKYRDDFAKALQDGVPYEYATHMMKMYAELEQLKASRQQIDAKAAHADEQRRLAKGEAAITRDPRAPQNADAYRLAKAEAAKKGITPDMPSFAAILAKHQH